MNNMFGFYNSTHLKKLQDLTAPLGKNFFLNDFTYIHLKNDHALVLGNRPAEKEYYWSNGFAKKSPYFFHPDLFQNQTLIASKQDQTTFHESQEEMHKKFGGLDTFLVSYQKGSDCGHIVLLSSTINSVPISSVLLSQFSALSDFCTQFISLWQPYMKKMDPYYINFAEACGPGFYRRNPKIDLGCGPTNKEQFLIDCNILPHSLKLTKREKEFCKWLLEGKNVREASDLMHISTRTGEQYAAQLKNLLKCYTKSEVISKLQLYDKHNLI